MAALCLAALSALLLFVEAAWETCDLRADDHVVWDASAAEYRVTREKALIGFVVDSAERRVAKADALPWEGRQFVEDAKGRMVLADGSYQIATFTDLVGLRHEPAVATARRTARDMGCWSSGGYTPDLCCGSGGWANCWGGPFTYEGCCGGWAAPKDPAFLDAVRSAFDEGHDTLMANPGNSPFYMHALVLAALVAGMAGTSSQVMVEVGVDEGAFAVHILRELTRRGVKVEKYYAVDPWTGPHAYKGDRSRSAFLTATQALAEFWPAPRVLQERGDLAASVVANGSADFVFVDAVHDYDYVLMHLELWWPKVKSGGLLAGHDYSPEKPGLIPGPPSAVQTFAARVGTAARLVGLPSSSFVMLKG